MSIDSGTKEVQDISVERILEDTKKGIPTGKWSTYKPQESYFLTLQLPHNSTITGSLIVTDTKEHFIKIDIVQVNPLLRGEKTGTGSRLVKALIKEAKNCDATVLTAHVTNLGMLKTLARVCGANLTFFKHVSGQKIELAYSDLLAHVEQIGEVNFDVHTDLTKIDSSSWESPKLSA